MPGTDKNRESSVGETVAQLAQVERRRRHLWIVASIVMLAVSGTVLFTSEGTLAGLVPSSPGLRWAALGVTAAFILYVVDKERALTRLTRALLEQHGLTSALEARVSALGTLAKVGRQVNSPLELDYVLKTVLQSSFELTAATSGAILLRVDDALKVVVSDGDRAEPQGKTFGLQAGIGGFVANSRDPVILTGRLTEVPVPGLREHRRVGGRTIVAPLVAEREMCGLLVLERADDAENFDDLDASSVALFADQAATAVVYAAVTENRRRESTDSTSQLRDTVAAFVHDLRSPLTAIVGYARMLRRRWESYDPEQREALLERVEQQADRLNAGVDDVLDTIMAPGPGAEEHGPVDLASLLDELAEVTRVLAEGREGQPRDVVVRSDLAQPTVPGDARALQHVFTNLFDNAMRYSPPGTPIEISLEGDDAECRVHVRDRGEGVDEDALARLLESGQERPPSVESGLGLHLVRRLVDEHGGRVWATSEQGAGSTFSVALPQDDRGAELPVTASAGGSAVAG